MSLLWIALAVYLLGFALALTFMIALGRAAKHADEVENQLLAAEYTTDDPPAHITPQPRTRRSQLPGNRTTNTNDRRFSRTRVRLVR